MASETTFFGYVWPSVPAKLQDCSIINISEMNQSRSKIFFAYR